MDQPFVQNAPEVICFVSCVDYFCLHLLDVVYFGICLADERDDC